MVFSAMEAPILPCAAAVVGVAPVSRRPPDIALAATLHDPPGALADAIAEGLPRLAALYRGVAVATSPPTAARVAAILAAHGAHAGATRANLRGPLYRLAIRGALATGAAHVHGLAPEVAYLECRGLDWETPDRHRRAVRRLGLPAWRRRQETPAEWARRITMAADFLAGFERALGRLPITRPAVRTFAPRAWRPLAPRRAQRWARER